MNTEALISQWNRAAVRGCMVCEHGRGVVDERTCAHPEVTRGCGGLVPVTQARSNDGRCGPEARHMYFDGLYSRR